jgi:hypothetical protein
MAASASEAFEHATELVMVRRFLVDGIDAVSRGDVVSVSAGIILVDLAVEMILKTAARHYEADVESELYKLQTGLTKADPKLAYVKLFSPLRKTRNCVVHDGTPQDAAAARDLVERARHLMVRLVHDVWDRDLLNLGVHDFIREPEVRDLLQNASAFLDARDPLNAIARTITALEILTSRWTRFTKRLFPASRDSKRERDARDEAVDSQLTALSAGIYLPHLQRYRRASHGIGAARSGTGKYYLTVAGTWNAKSPEQQLEDARFALEFVSGVALQMDQRIDLLDKSQSEDERLWQARQDTRPE